MSDICCGVPVPPVPERPIDLAQPAYVLVDGRWVLLSEIISEYLPPTPPPGDGVVLQVKHVSFPQSVLASYSGSATKVGPTVSLVPASPTSRLKVTVSTSLQIVGQASQSLPNLTYLGLRRETSSGVLESGTGWINRANCEIELITGQRCRNHFIESDFGSEQRRSDTADWGVVLYYTQNQAQLSALVTDLQYTFVEYEPTA
ncbi:hypothetical protein JP75_05510 [Devosia riboflavina]|uniref:Uncharacterized protein n=1 Tax=Devosia riboflavina TaxID=46914 RepID=A0A087M4R3_9HYPH|nr:hypothetical protein [Devosia riboflavina]KFL31866.1 hypothetical protein JP75_05510 [Devosia riboflavina]